METLYANVSKALNALVYQKSVATIQIGLI